MARTREFATHQVVVAARSVFWEHGYEETSVPQLEQAAGLSRSSIYHAFGSKRGLFDACVQNYLDEVIRPRLRPLQQDPVEPGALDDHLAGLREALVDVASAPGRHGCLLMNAAGAPVARHEVVASQIAAYREELRVAVRRGLVAARSADGDPEARLLDRDAEACTALVTSAFALIRVDQAAALRCLDAARALI